MAPMWDRIDPLAEKYYGISPYAYCGGDPVNFGDYDGRKVSFVDKEMENLFYQTLAILNSYGVGKELQQIVDDENINVRIQTPIYKTGSGSTNAYQRQSATVDNQPYDCRIFWDPTLALVIENNENYVLTPVEGLAHEAGHAWQDIYKHEQFEEERDPKKSPDPDFDTKEERRNITETEQKVARGLKRLDSRKYTRTDHHSGTFMHVDIGAGKTKNLVSVKFVRKHE